MNSLPKFKGVIFDLDMTLVDSCIAKDFRKARDWQKVYSLIPSFILYPGVLKAFEYIQIHKIKTAIVSTAPRPYIEKVIKYFNMPIDVIVGYHDANRVIKPKPDQMLLALQNMGLMAYEVVSFGDRAIDIVASNAAGIESIACFWGTEEYNELKYSSFKSSINQPSEIISKL